MNINFYKKPEPRLWEWHTWYAWFPVFTRERNGKRSLIWLEDVDRMRATAMFGYRWVYEVKAK